MNTTIARRRRQKCMRTTDYRSNEQRIRNTYYDIRIRIINTNSIRVLTGMSIKPITKFVYTESGQTFKTTRTLCSGTVAALNGTRVFKILQRNSETTLSEELPYGKKDIRTKNNRYMTSELTSEKKRFVNMNIRGKKRFYRETFM